MSEKTHYRKAFNSPYLSSGDIVEPTVFTVKCVKLESDKTKKTKDFFNTAYFVEPEIRHGEKLKPMILNATNSRTMRLLANSAFIDDWNNIPVTVYVDPNVRNRGEVVEGLRISTEPPKMQRRTLEPNTEAWNHAIAAYKRDGDLSAVKKHVDVSPEHEKLIIEQAKANA